MYSYFVWLSMPNGDFIRLNVASGMKPEHLNNWAPEFYKSVDKRLKELGRTERTKDFFRIRVLLDPAEGGGGKRYPGRATYELTS